jgi:hypothetical protein
LGIPGALETFCAAAREPAAKRNRNDVILENPFISRNI